jgi:membrane associated rhomboid family serine protease
MPIRLTPVVKTLLISNLVLFLIQQTADRFLGGNVTGLLGLVPYSFVVEHHFWQLLTYLFLHGDVMHLLLNMLMLAFVGGELESIWGRWRFLRFYLICGMSAGVLYLLLQVFRSELTTPMVGASGAIYGLLMAYGLLFGERVLLFMMLFPMKAKHFVWVLMGVEFMSSLFSGRNGLSSAAHLGGMVAGLVYLWTVATWRRMQRSGKGPGLPKWPRQGKTSRKHLKLVVNRPPNLDSDDDADPGPKTWH